jgi:Fe-S cluster assembly protein SufD
METMTLPGTVAGVRGLSSRLGEPGWLTDWRVRAFEQWQASELPIRANHLWRYTDPAIFDPADDPPAGGFSGPGMGAANSAGGSGGFEISARLGPEGRADGSVKSRIDGGGKSRATSGSGVPGLILTDLATAAREHPDLVRSALGSVVGPEHGRFEALAAATFRGGVFLRVPKGVVVPDPVHLAEQFGREAFQVSRLLVIVEEGASVTVVDELEGGPDKDGRIFSVAELVVGAQARVQFVTLQELGPRVQAHLTQVARLGRGAHYTPVLASFGGALVKTNIGAILEGEGSESEMTGFLSAVGRQRFDHHTLHHHVGRHTRSNLDYKTVLTDRSRSTYTGLIRIEKEASFSEAYQENRNLLLSEHARVDSIPELEILTEEVQCTHGATVGPIDREHLFYLMSRAIPRGEAVRMVIEGHFESALKRLPEALQERMRTLVRERLRGA